MSAMVTGLHGTVAINSDGSYIYTLDNSNAAVEALRSAAPRPGRPFDVARERVEGVQPAAAAEVPSMPGVHDAGLYTGLAGHLAILDLVHRAAAAVGRATRRLQQQKAILRRQQVDASPCLGCARGGGRLPRPGGRRPP